MKKNCQKYGFIYLLFCMAVIFNLYGLKVEKSGVINSQLLSGSNIQRILGLNRGIPIGSAVKTISGINVVPGGQSIGIVLHSKGIIVVGMSDILDESGNRTNPAEEAGLKIGDIILTVNGKEINSELLLRNEIAQFGKNQKKVELELKRGGKVHKVVVKTVNCIETGRPRIGLFVRDSASGVGTLSFYHPDTGIYGALGHIITDVDTARGIDLSGGKIVEAQVRAIHRGKKGSPGEKIGMFIENSPINGNIDKNSHYGIFGKLSNPLQNPYYSAAVPVAMSHQIKTGPAEILTVIEGTEIKKYSVEIQEVFYPWSNQGKGLIIKVTDNDLIKNTGGIIQGMSGSPIMQNGMLVGVVTHVFINDPSRGYGILAEWMLKEIGIKNSDKSIQKVS